MTRFPLLQPIKDSEQWWCLRKMVGTRIYDSEESWRKKLYPLLWIDKPITYTYKLWKVAGFKLIGSGFRST